jgi:hypothetical protein
MTSSIAALPPGDHPQGPDCQYRAECEGDGDDEKAAQDQFL